MKNLLTFVLLFAAILFGNRAYSQIKGEAACRKFLQEDFFKRFNDWSTASSGTKATPEESAKRYAAVTEVLAVGKIGAVNDQVAAANPHKDGWFGFFRHLAEERKPFHCALLNAKAICESRQGTWMIVEFELKYADKLMTVYDYMCVQSMPFGSVVNMVSVNPPTDCVFDPASYITVGGRVVDDLGVSLTGYSVAVKNTYTAQVPNYEVKFRNEVFSIDNVPPFSALEFTKPGYDSLLIPINSKTDLQVLKMTKSPIREIEVSGKVLDELGVPITNFKVELKGESESGAKYNVQYRNYSFTIGKIPVESVITISKPGYEPLDVEVNYRTDLEMVKLVRIPVTEISVTGKVLDDIGNPLKNFMVMVKDSSVEDYFVTFRDEAFTIGEIPHESSLVITKAGYDTLEAAVDKRTDLGMLKLHKLPLTIISVTGKVVDEIGNSLSNFSVEVTDTLLGQSKYNHISYKDDMFTIHEVPIDGSFVVSKYGYEPLVVEVNNRSERVVKLRKAPLPIIRVSGRVLDEFGNSLSDFRVQVRDSASMSESYYEISTKHDAFVIGKAPFNASVTISKPGYQTLDVDIDNRESLGILKLAKAPTPPSYIPGSFTETVNKVPFNMVFIAGGKYRMGATDEQAKEAGFLEKPVHEVSVGDFLISQTEVTLRVWKAVMESVPDGMDESVENMPVANVSWTEVQAFVSKLSAITGKKYRLPYEAEWEYAARGASQSRGYKYSGSNKVDDVAWYDFDSNKKLHIVGSKSPNEVDLYDMSGNVWEWCLDEYRDYDAPDYSAFPSAQGNGDRIYRGGGAFNEAGYSRVSYRHYLAPDYRTNSLGFRLVLPADGKLR